LRRSEGDTSFAVHFGASLPGFSDAAAGAGAVVFAAAGRDPFTDFALFNWVGSIALRVLPVMTSADGGD
jgi:hypothetical protein